MVNWTLLQICVAVLLDSFVSTRRQFDMERQAKQSEAAAARGTIRSTLDPLLESLARHFSDDADLTFRLKDLFKVRQLQSVTEGVWCCGKAMAVTSI